MTVGTALLRQLPLAGQLVTDAALYCHQDVCTAVVAARGDYLVTVKANQPTLYAAIAALFASPPPGEVFAQAAQQGRHGDRFGVRRLAASGALTDYLAWPGARQVLRVVRTVRRQGKLTEQVRYSITSLAAGALAGDAASLLRRRRGQLRTGYIGFATKPWARMRATFAAAPRHKSWRHYATR